MCVELLERERSARTALELRAGLLTERQGASAEEIVRAATEFADGGEGDDAAVVVLQLRPEA